MSLYYFKPIQFSTDIVGIKWEAETLIEKWLRENLNKKCWADIGRETGVRTLNQNSWYWGVVLSTIARDTGHTEKELHRIFKDMFLPKKKTRWKDREYLLDTSTSSLGKPEFGEYIERIRAEVASLGIIIPDPQ